MPRYWNDPRLGAARRGAPVVSVTWWEASAYCRWLLRHWAVLEEGQENPGLQPALIRLPTEAEWAKAAGGEMPKLRYPWDAPGRATRDKAEIFKRANVSESFIRRTTLVGMYPQGASEPYQLWDLVGNVSEWQANYYNQDHAGLALRGGSWLSNLKNARVAVRFSRRPDPHWCNYGLRVVALPRGAVVS